MPYYKGHKISDIEYLYKKYGHRSKKLLNSKLKELEIKTKLKKENKIKSQNWAEKVKHAKQIKLEKQKRRLTKLDHLYKTSQIKEKKLKKNCEYCGNVFYPAKVSDRYRFCSPKCCKLFNQWYKFKPGDKCKCGRKKQKFSKLCIVCSNKKKKRNLKTGLIIKNILTKAGRLYKLPNS